MELEPTREVSPGLEGRAVEVGHDVGLQLSLEDDKHPAEADEFVGEGFGQYFPHRDDKTVCSLPLLARDSQCGTGFSVADEQVG